MCYGFVFCHIFVVPSKIFNRPDLGPNIGPFLIKKMNKDFPNWCKWSPNFFVLHSNGNSIKIGTIIPSYRCMKFCIKMWTKACFRSHFYANFHEFLWQQICYSITLLIPYMFLIYLKWWSGCFRLHQVFPILMVQMIFPNSTGPWTWLKKGRKIPGPSSCLF